MRARAVTAGIVACGAVLAGTLAWWGYRNGMLGGSEASLLQRLPTQDAAVLSVDFAELRHSGLLQKMASGPTAQEPEYAAFVRDSGLNYQTDLDYALVAFATDGTFLLVRGRFDWAKLENYARARGGTCSNGLCRMTGSQPDRRISYLPLNRHLMALAVSRDDVAATRLQHSGPQRLVEAPRDPVWLNIPAAAWKRGAGLPAGTQLFLSGISGADQVLVSVGPSGQELEARLSVDCHSPQEATALAVQLQQAATTLRDLLAGKAGGKPGATPPDDLGMLLTAGVFAQNGNKVTGRWPLRKAFLDSLIAGI